MASSEPAPSAPAVPDVPLLDAASVPAPQPALDSKGEHLLQSSWTFWFARKMAKNAQYPENYADHLQKIATFNTVEGFYRTYVYITRANELPKDSNFHLFRGDTVPMWESFPNGGTWTFRINRKAPSISLLWEELILNVIGEVFEEPDIMGIVLSVRTKEHIFAVWNADAQNNALRARVYDKLKYYLRLDPSTPIEYKSNSANLSQIRIPQQQQSQPQQPQQQRNGKAGNKDKKKKKKGGNKGGAHPPAAPAQAPAASAPAPAASAPAPAASTPAPAQTPAAPTPTPAPSTPAAPESTPKEATTTA